MHRPESAPRPSRSRLIPASCLLLVLSLAVVAACSADEARDAAIRDLAVGSWACAPDAGGPGEQPFTVHIEDDGTFGVSVEEDSTIDGDVRPGVSISGKWAIEDGDLEWGFVDAPVTGEFLVEGFDDLTLESTGFTLENAGIFEANDGSTDPAEEQDIIAAAHGTDSVTLRAPEGEPWTCNRQ